MKNLNLMSKTNFRNFALAGILTFAVILTGCDKKDDIYSSEMEMAEQEAQLKSGKAVKKGDMSIAEIAIDAGFSELVAALTLVDDSLNAGLVNLFLNGTDQYTVFAPSNDAFFALYDALGEGVSSISDLPPALVLDVLLYHVTDGRRAANSVVPRNNSRMIETLLGQYFSVDASGMITAASNTANIVAPDISASNGIIHVIDAVILPAMD